MNGPLLRNHGSGLNELFQDDDLPQVVMNMFSNPGNIPVVIAIFLIGKIF